MSDDKPGVYRAPRSEKPPNGVLSQAAWRLDRVHDILEDIEFKRRWNYRIPVSLVEELLGHLKWAEQRAVADNFGHGGKAVQGGEGSCCQ